MNEIMTDWLTDRQIDRQAHREISLPIKSYLQGKLEFLLQFQQIFFFSPPQIRSAQCFLYYIYINIYIQISRKRNHIRLKISEILKIPFSKGGSL